MKSQKYKDWVKTLPCCGCGTDYDIDPHHLIGQGFGCMGGKESDFHTMPLCRNCHNRLHHRMCVWEDEYGHQVSHIIKTQRQAMQAGVITWQPR